MEASKTRKRGLWALRIIAATAGALFLAIGALGAPASAETAPSPESEGVQIEAVEADSPVTVADTDEYVPEDVTTRWFCPVRDGTFGFGNCTLQDPNRGLNVAILYEHGNYNRDRDGWAIVVYNPEYEYGCTSGYGDNEGGANLINPYANEVSSVRTFNHCDVKLFNRPDKQGESSPWIHNDTALGGMNNRAESFRIS